MRLKKFWPILLIVALLAVAAGAIGTQAWFTDVATITDNYVTTGNLDLEVGGGPLVVQNLEPGAGYKSAGYFYAKNIGTYDMKWRGWLDNVNDPKGLRSYLRVKCIMNPTGHVGNYGPPDTELWSGVPFTALESPNSYILLDGTTAAVEFEPGHYAWYEIQVALVSSAPNAVQSAQVDARLYLEATQWINSGWAE